MIAIDIPGFDRLQIDYLVMGYNGTLAVEGALIDGVAERIRELSAHVQIHVLTADTYASATRHLRGLPIWFATVPPSNQAQAKLAYIRKLGSGACVAIGNGRNDRLMLEDAALSIAMIQREGGAVDAIQAAHLAMVSINATLDLFLYPERLVATLQS